MSGLGFVIPAASIGLGALLIKPQRGFFVAGSADNPSAAIPILVPQATIEEHHQHELEVTEHPIEMGAPIADHAYKRPAIVRIRGAWSNSPSTSSGLIGAAVAIGVASGGSAARVLSSLPATIGAIQTIGSILTGNDPGQVRQIFDTLLALQESRIPFDVFTGKRSYTNMILRTVAEETNERTENALSVIMTCQQVIIVGTRVVSAVGSDPTVMKTPELNSPILDLGAQNLKDAGTFQVPEF